ncbi:MULTISPECIES: hypothetical protein [unclassified Corallococcus]|uniref:hypothetical protein n=1 Tax=unclassified Corallococcus TaxID=2685029 RepID=UPI001A8E6764|nr:MULTISPECIES: hypothetical protein [unclassified Corallococcus]MBN9685074.1 hypothetical protein [Corallococcus sp. NCSPR001]WAS83467.1 hypothetical protein O0N60_29645 [Corallococcus sp. NCRR]
MHRHATRQSRGILQPLVTALGLAAIATGSGCLIPQDVALLESLPEFRNRPPRILEEQVEPSERILRAFGVGSCTQDFNVVVEDLDVDDRITVEWYVDYNPSNPTGYYRQIVLANTGQPRRDDRGTLRMDLRSANNPLAPPGIHLVEAFVTDRHLTNRQPDPPDEVILADGGVVKNPGFVTSYSWVVNTVAGDCQ